MLMQRSKRSRIAYHLSVPDLVAGLVADLVAGPVARGGRCIGVVAFALIAWIAFALASPPALANATVFEAGEKGVFQVRLSHTKTREKAIIGSGFLIDRGDLIATNYHVVSQLIREPDEFDLEIVVGPDDRRPATIIGVDVVRDLAVLKVADVLGSPFTLGPTPARGANLFSMGNPLDLGLTLSESTNNGPLARTNEQRILLSGTLNPGMSGGPTFDSNGLVVGINVARAGDELSLIIPANFLAALLTRLKARDYSAPEKFSDDIAAQLVEYLRPALARFAQGERPTQTLGEFNVPTALDETIRCWDQSSRADEEDLYRLYKSVCNTEHDIYLASYIQVGQVGYSFTWLESDTLGAARFARAYERLHSNSSLGYSEKRDHTRYDCLTEFVTIAGRPFKTSLCRRDYLEYEGLSDLLFSAALVGGDRRGFVIGIEQRGVTHREGVLFVQRLLNQVSMAQP